MKKEIKAGSRDSILAVAQSMILIDKMRLNNPDIYFRLVTMKTTGDQILDKNLYEAGGKGLFVKELDLALLEGKIDIAIHSMKDLPAEIIEDIPLIAFSEREDPRDVMVLRKGCHSFKNGVIGTSSRRRMVQLERLYPEAVFKGIRGNINTRLKKLGEGGYDALVLSRAGLIRLGMEDIAYRVFSTDEIIPAAGQGILAVQGRKDGDYPFVECIKCKNSLYAGAAERSFVRALGEGCSSPVAAYARVCQDNIKIQGMYFDEGTGRCITGERTGRKEDAEETGRELALELRYNRKT